MTDPFGIPRRAPDAGVTWQRWSTASSLVDALALEFDGVDDLTALTGTATPQWVHELPVPPHWQQLELPHTDGGSVITPARLLVSGPLRQDPGRGGGWVATDTIQVYGYTGIPAFGDVLGSTARTLGDLDGRGVHTRMLTMPILTGVAAERSTATVTVDGAPPVWTQLTNYVAGSDVPHAGRLVVHSIAAAEPHHGRLTGDIAMLTRTVADAVAKVISARGTGPG